MLLNMKELLAVARAHDFAVPAFNISSSMLLKGAIEAAEEAAAPVIVAIHPDELAFVGTAFVKMALAEAADATVPVVIHLDHGSSMEQIMTAIRAGFTSVMIDASELPLPQNIAACREVTNLAHAVNVSVEGELGTIGELDEEAEAGADEVIFVNPDEVKQFVDATHVDTLAVAIGTSHGLYPKGHEAGNPPGSAARHPRQSGYASGAAWRLGQPGRRDRPGGCAGHQQDQHLG